MQEIYRAMRLCGIKLFQLPGSLARIDVVRSTYRADLHSKRRQIQNCSIYVAIGSSRSPHGPSSAASGLFVARYRGHL